MIEIWTYKDILKIMYSIFIQWIARPFYRYVVKPICKAVNAIILALCFSCLFVAYLFITASGMSLNVIINAVLWVLALSANEFFLYHFYTTLFLSFYSVLTSVFLLYIVVNLCDHNSRSYILDKEPPFITHFFEIMSDKFDKICNDVKNSEEVIKKIKEEKRRKKLEKIAKQIVLREKQEAENNMIKSRAEILDIRE